MDQFQTWLTVLGALLAVGVAVLTIVRAVDELTGDARLRNREATLRANLTSVAPDSVIAHLHRVTVAQIAARVVVPSRHFYLGNVARVMGVALGGAVGFAWVVSSGAIWKLAAMTLPLAAVLIGSVGVPGLAGKRVQAEWDAYEALLPSAPLLPGWRKKALLGVRWRYVSRACGALGGALIMAWLGAIVAAIFGGQQVGLAYLLISQVSVVLLAAGIAIGDLSALSRPADLDRSGFDLALTPSVRARRATPTSAR